MTSMSPRHLSRVIGILSLLGCVYGQALTAFYESYVSDCKLSKSFLETTASSLPTCCSRCMEDGRCQSVSYRELDGTCVLHDVCPSECSSHGQEEPGWFVLCRDNRGRKPPASYKDIQQSSLSSPDGVYVIYPYNQTGERVYCDMTTEGGGWTVFQYRFDGSVDFYKGWEDYNRGFGDPDGEHWLGNDLLHELTQQGACQLRVDMVTEDDEVEFAVYSDFTIGSEQQGYILSHGHYFGTAGNALSQKWYEVHHS